ncbi:MAG: hypothetical protein ACK5U7_11395 [Bacteroidota bacterium]|jgi:hypothetical protein
MHKLLSVPRRWCKNNTFRYTADGKRGACCLLGAVEHVVGNGRHPTLTEKTMESRIRTRLGRALGLPKPHLRSTIDLAYWNDHRERKLPEVLALIKKAQSPRYASRP